MQSPLLHSRPLYTSHLRPTMRFPLVVRVSHRPFIFHLMQANALLSKPSVVAVIEELERLLKVVEAPLKQEIEAARAIARAEGAAEATAAATLAAAVTPPKPQKSPKEWEKEKKAAVTKARTEATIKAQAEAKITLENAIKDASVDAINTTLQTVLEILYFSSLLDPYAPYSAERNACLYSAHQSRSSLTQDEINTLCYVGRLLTMKAYYSPESHKDALAACKEVALRVISQPEEQVHPTVQLGVTGKCLKQTVEAIKALDFFTRGPGGPPLPPAMPAAMPPPYYHQGLGNTINTSMAPVTGMPHFPQQQQQQQMPLTPTLAALLGVPVPTQVVEQKQDPVISVPTPQTSTQELPEKPIKKEQNLMHTLFGSGLSGLISADVQQQEHKTKEQEQQPSESVPSLNNDVKSGIEDMVIAPPDEKTENIVASPIPTALPTPSPAVLAAGAAVTAPVQGVAKKRNHSSHNSSRGSSQSRGSGAGPVLVEAGGGGAGGGGGTAVAVGAAGEGASAGTKSDNHNRRRGKAKKQAIQQEQHQDKPAEAVQQQQQTPKKQQQLPVLQFSPQQKEQRPPPAPASTTTVAAAAPTTNSTDAAAKANPPRLNSKNRYYQRKPRTQQSQQPQQV
jgi:hypothetical protein